MLDYRQVLDKPMAAHRQMLGVAVACAAAGYRSSVTAASDSSEGFDVIQAIGVIDVCGLLRRGGGCASYAQVRANIARAMSNPQIAGVVLSVDSMGGETSDLFSCADFLYAQRGTKPIYSWCDPAFAGSYLLASCADRVYVSVTGGVGSVGCCAVHVDLSEADKQAGVKISFISSGSRKLFGNPHSPLADGARSELQIEVDRISRMMIDRVGRNRKVPARRIEATQAGTFFGERAVPLLADEVGSLDDAVSDMMATCGIAGRGKYSSLAREKRRLSWLRLTGPVPTDLDQRKRKLERLREER